MCYLYDIMKCFVRNDEIKLWNQSVIVALNNKSASMLLEPTKNKLKQWLVIEKSVNKCNFFPNILKF